MNAPEALFQPTGNWDSGSVVTLEVKVCIDKNGQLWSTHEPQGIIDHSILETWPGNGVRAIAHALLVEAVRREAYMCVLAMITKDPDVVAQYAIGDSSIKTKIGNSLTDAMVKTLSTVVREIAPNVAKEILAMVSGG